MDFLDPVLEFFKTVLGPVWDFFVSTKVPEQIDSIDPKGLFTNPWFLVPFIAGLAWEVYKTQFVNIIIILLLMGSWAFFGTPYMKDLAAQDEIELGAILPLVAGACAVLAIIVYLLFFKKE